MCSSQTCKGCFTMFKIKSAIFMKPLHPSAHLKLVKMSSKIITNGKASGNQSENAIVGALIMEKLPFFLRLCVLDFQNIVNCLHALLLLPPAFWRTASAGGFRMTTPFIYPCLSPLKCHQDIVLWILINCGGLQEASAEPRGLTSEFPGVAAAAAAAAWCHMEPHAAPPRTNCTLDAACYFPILLLCCFPAQPLLCRSQSLLCMSRVDIYLLISVKRTCQLGVEKCWNAAAHIRPLLRPRRVPAEE